MRNITFIIHLLFLTVSEMRGEDYHSRQVFRWTLGKVDGFVKNTLHTDSALSRFTKNSHLWTFVATVFRKNHPYKNRMIPVEQFTAEGVFYRTGLSVFGKTFFFTAGVSGLAGYGLINRIEALLDDGSTLLSKNKILTG
jgi:hypothetical protein